jgi:NusA-like KH domain protein
VARVKLDQHSFGVIQIVEKMLRVPVKDVVQDDGNMWVVVPTGMLGKALGKGAVNVKKLQTKFDLRVKMIEYKDDVVSFIRNVVYPVKVEEIVLEEGVVICRDSNRKTKSLLFGRDGANLEMVKRSVSRFFDVDVKVE